MLKSEISEISGFRFLILRMCAVQFPAIHRKKVSEIAHDILKEKILSKELAPGQRLNLDEIEIQLGISQTPLKEALALLEMEGLVKILPRSGTFISTLLKKRSWRHLKSARSSKSTQLSSLLSGRARRKSTA